MILRLAFHLATSWRPEHRWRRVALPAAGTLSLALVLLAASVGQAFQYQSERIEARQLVVVEHEQPTDLWVRSGADEWDQTQYAVLWFEPASSEPPVLPPGMDALPEPGVAVVSPALAQLIEQNPPLANRYPRYQVLGNEGIADEDELLAWIRPQEEGALSQVGLRVSGFGTSDDDPRPTDFTMDFTIVSNPSRETLGLGLFAFLVLPALLILYLGLTSASRLRAERLAILHALGAGWGWTTRFVLAEALLLLLPPILVLTALWALVAPRVDYLPLVRKDVIAGDLGLAAGELLIVVIGYLLATILILVLTSVLPQATASATSVRPRPVNAGRRVSLVRLIPLIGAALLIFYGILQARQGHRFEGGRTFVYGLAVLIAVLPLAVPTLIAPLGDALARIGTVPALLAGRRLEWDPLRSARPLAMLASLITLTIVVVAQLNFLRDYDPPFDSGMTPSAATVSWSGQDPRSMERAQQLLSPNPVFAFGEGPPTGQGPTLLLGATCADVARALHGDASRCQADDALPEEFENELARLLLTPSVQLDPALSPVQGGRVSVVVLSETSAGRLDEMIRGTLPLAEYPGLSVRTATSFELREPAAAQWLNVGIIVGLIVIGLGCLVALVDRTIALQSDRKILLDIGFPSQDLRKIEGLAFLVPYLAIVIASLVLGLLNVQAYQTIQGSVHLPASALATLVLGLLVAGFIGTIAVMELGTVGQQSDADRLAQGHTLLP